MRLSARVRLLVGRDMRSGTSLLIGCVALAACTVWRPGRDPRGLELIATGDTLVVALEEFRQANGRYPASLQDLPGSYSLGAPGTGHCFRYSGEAAGYRLSLDYSPSWPQSGKVNCATQAGAAGWACHTYL